MRCEDLLSTYKIDPEVTTNLAYSMSAIISKLLKERINATLKSKRGIKQVATPRASLITTRHQLALKGENN